MQGVENLRVPKRQQTVGLAFVERDNWDGTESNSHAERAADFFFAKRCGV